MYDPDPANAMGETIGITYYRSAGGSWFSSCMDATAKTIEKLIVSGDIQAKASLRSNSTGNDALAEIAETSASSSIVVYPNPSSDPVNFRFSIPMNANVTLEVYSSTGRLIDRVFQGGAEQGTEIKAVISKPLPEGMYSYKLIYGNQGKSGKFIKTTTAK